MPKYKWDNPLEWLTEKANSWEKSELYCEFMELARRMDFDTLQDIYQSDMSKDGYFEKYTSFCPNCNESKTDAQVTEWGSAEDDDEKLLHAELFGNLKPGDTVPYGICQDCGKYTYPLKED